MHSKYLIAGIVTMVFSVNIKAQTPSNSTRRFGYCCYTPALPMTQHKLYKKLETQYASTDPAAVQAASSPAAIQSTQYFDGLGRPIQVVTKEVSPSGKDMVAPTLYDSMGRERYKYLPYVATTGDGKFKTNPFNDQKTFYMNAALAPGAAGETIYYTQTEYEPTPLNRVSKEYGVGNSWAKEGGSRPLETQYLVNTAADSVRIWDMPTSGMIPTSTSGRIYAAGALLKNVTKDERGLRTIEYKDKKDRLILRKSEFVTGATAAHAGWLCVYYVYDDLENLRCIIPPKAVVNINSSWIIDAGTATELCFFYRFDIRKRNIVKKMPGADSTEMVYDGRDRLAFFRDGALKARGIWQVKFYDELNREIMSGLFTDARGRDALQTSINSASSSPQTLTHSILL